MNTALEPCCGQVLLMVTSSQNHNALWQLLAELAGRGPLRVLDGGNCFNAYLLARALRRSTTKLPEVMQRIGLARAFTCYQMASLLAETPAHPSPIVILDFLATFYDESVRYADRHRLLEQCIQCLGVLRRQAMVVITVRPVRPNYHERIALLDRLRATASRVWEAEPEIVHAPARLF